VIKRVAWALAALAMVAVAAAAIGLRLIDTPAVRAEIQSRLSAVLGGRIEWEALEVRILPAPHGELRRVRVEIPDALSAQAEQVDVYLRLRPLLRGEAQIASVSVLRPEIRLAPSGGGKPDAAPLDPLAAYRQAIEPVVRALQKFAPQTEIRIQSASIEVAAAGLQLRELSIAARTTGESLELQVETASNRWKRLQGKGHIAYADLSARAEVEVDELAVDRDLPAARLRAALRTDAKTSVEGDIDAALGSLVHEAKAKVVLPAGKPPEATVHLSGVDLAGALAIARRRLPGLDALESAEGRLSAKVDLALGEAWRADIHIVKSDAAVKLAQLPWKLSAAAGQVAVSARAVHLRAVRGALGESTFSDLAARIDLGRRPRLSSASGQATLRLEQWFPWLRQRVAPLEAIDALSGGVEVSLTRLALRFDRPAEVSFDAVATPRQVSATLQGLPAPVGVTGGSLQVSAAQVRMDRLAVAMLDARALVSGTVATKGPKVELALAEGALGEKIVQWALARGEVPARFEPRTPLRFAAKRIAWAPGAPLEAEAALDFEGGPGVAAALAWRPEKLDLRRLAIKDARSDAVLSAATGGDLLQAGFSGTLYGRSIASMLRQPQPQGDSGVARGTLRLSVDRKRPQRSVAEGRLRVEALDLTWLAGAKVLLKSIDFSADRSTLRIAEAQLEWQEQPVSLSGEIRSTDQGPVIDARLESPGVVVERLLPAETPGATSAEPKGASKLWPLPVTGRVEVRAGFIQYQHHKIAPFEGGLVLERQRARLDVKQARMCGISFPLAGEAAPDGLAVSARITMQNEPMDLAMRCLTGNAMEITGNADLRADLSTRGKAEDLIRNLTGTAQAELRKGRVKKFALIGNILSLRDIASLHGMKEDGFAYRSLSARGRFAGGDFLLEEGFFDSDAARLAASGRIDLHGANTELNVLVGLLTTVDRVAGAIPLLGDVFGGSLTALPVTVTGDIRNPRVVPLGPRAVSDRLLGIFERTLKLPGKLIVHPPGEAPPATR